MKKLILLVCIILTSCQGDGKLQYIGQEIIDGKVSYTDPGYRSTNPRIWVQTATTTREISIPFNYERRWKVGDSCLLIIEKYKEIPEKK